MTRRPLNPLSKLLLLILLAGCGQPTDKNSNEVHVLDSIDLSLITRTVDQFREAVSDHSNSSVISIEALHLSVENFLEDPSTEHQLSMQDHWVKAHNLFLAASLFSFADQDKNIFQIDAWPIREGFLDSLPDYPQSGIINDLTLEISATTMRAQHGITDAQEVSLGFHALEFLVFARAVDDFSLSVNEIKARRRQTLDIVARLLGQDIDTLFGTTNQLDGDFRSKLDENNAPKALRLLLRRLYAKVQILFSEVNQIDDEILSHSRFSHSSWSNLTVQIKVLSELTGERTAMGRVFTLLDQKTAADYRLTLTRAKDILATAGPGEEKLARMTLLFAALGHQLNDFLTVLENGTHR